MTGSLRPWRGESTGIATLGGLERHGSLSEGGHYARAQKRVGDRLHGKFPATTRDEDSDPLDEDLFLNCHDACRDRLVEKVADAIGIDGLDKHGGRVARVRRKEAFGKILGVE
jgi:hypothetical protein